MKILLLDDEVCVQEWVTDVLAGHEVRVASDGNEALNVYKEHAPFDIVLADWCHEGPTGEELVRAIHQMDPKQSIAFITGYSCSSVAGCPVLHKPFGRDELLEFLNRYCGRIEHA